MRIPVSTFSLNRTVRVMWQLYPVFTRTAGPYRIRLPNMNLRSWFHSTVTNRGPIPSITACSFLIINHHGWTFGVCPSELLDVRVTRCDWCSPRGKIVRRNWRFFWSPTLAWYRYADRRVFDEVNVTPPTQQAAFIRRCTPSQPNFQNLIRYNRGWFCGSFLTYSARLVSEILAAECFFY